MDENFSAPLDGDPAPGEDGTAGGTGAGRPRVLVVDDHRGMRRQIAALLREILPGGAIEGVGSVREAVAAAAHQPHDLFLVDVQLPDGNGIRLGARLRALGHDAPIVFVALVDSPAQRAAIRRIPCSDFVGKHELAACLPAAVRRALGPDPSARRSA
jgi:DNA-binding NarL/FixJ family response regulator